MAYDFGGADKAASRCKKRELAIQAGGCVGTWPRYLRTLFWNVFTFEPSPENIELLRKNLATEDVRIFHAALGEASGKCGIVENPHNCGDDRTLPLGDIDRIAIDDLRVAPDLIYLDVQGDELSVLKGAKRTIEVYSPIIAVEYDEPIARVRAGDPRPWLEDMGYVRVDKHSADLIFERTPHGH